MVAFAHRCPGPEITCRGPEAPSLTVCPEACGRENSLRVVYGNASGRRQLPCRRVCPGLPVWGQAQGHPTWLCSIAGWRSGGRDWDGRASRWCLSLLRVGVGG